MLHVVCRFVVHIASCLGFILTCTALRLVEGVGTAIISTAVLSTFPSLYPERVATLMVPNNFHWQLHFVALNTCRPYLN